jgi:c-di-GMP-binding flagellar brake protein YcgR
MEIPEKRLTRRLRVNLPISYQRMGKVKSFGDTVAKDISTTGLRLSVATFFQPQSQVLVKVQFPEVNKTIEAMAHVVWSHRISFSDQYQAGLHFSEINPVFKKWLEEYILINEALSG